MLLADFCAQYPEFGNVPGFAGQPGTQVQIYLNAAAAQMGTRVWGVINSSASPNTLQDQAHGLLTAHLLELSPYGQNARLMVNGLPSSTYKTRFDEMQMAVTAGLYRCL